MNAKKTGQSVEEKKNLKIRRLPVVVHEIRFPKFRGYRSNLLLSIWHDTKFIYIKYM